MILSAALGNFLPPTLANPCLPGSQLGASADLFLYSSPLWYFVLKLCRLVTFEPSLPCQLGHLPAFTWIPPPAPWPGNSLRASRQGSCWDNPIRFPSLWYLHLSLPEAQCLISKLSFHMLCLFLVVPDRRVNPISVPPSWPEVKLHDLLLIQRVSNFGIYKNHLVGLMKMQMLLPVMLGPGEGTKNLCHSVEPRRTECRPMSTFDLQAEWALEISQCWGVSLRASDPTPACH